MAGVATSASRLLLGVDLAGRPLFGAAYGLALSSQPTHRVEVRLSVANESLRPGSAPETHLSQRDFVFTREDWHVERLVHVNATSARADPRNRNEKILHTITSLDPMYRGPAGEPAAGVGAANEGLGPHVAVSVVVSRDREPPPQVQSGEFLPSGGGALVAFDRDTDRAGLEGSFPCGRILVGPAAQGLGAKSRCAWRSDAALSITFASDAAVAPGEAFGVRNKLLRNAARGSTLYATNATGRLERPAAAVAPTVVLAAPARLGPCDGLVVDARPSTGSAGRPLAVTWNVTFADFQARRRVVPSDVSLTNASVANLSLAVWEASRGAGALVLRVPNPFPGANNPAVPFATMRFTATVRNWLGLEGSASVEVTKAAADAPDGADPRLWRRRRRVRRRRPQAHGRGRPALVRRGRGRRPGLRVVRALGPPERRRAGRRGHGPAPGHQGPRGHPPPGAHLHL